MENTAGVDANSESLDTPLDAPFAPPLFRAFEMVMLGGSLRHGRSEGLLPLRATQLPLLPVSLLPHLRE